MAREGTTPAFPPAGESADPVLVVDRERVDGTIEADGVDPAVADLLGIEPEVPGKPLSVGPVGVRGNDDAGGVEHEPDFVLHDATVTDLVATHIPRATLVATLTNPDITLARAAGTYILYKSRRLTAASERSYRAALGELTKNHPNMLLREFEPPNGTILIEDFLQQRYGHLAERTYNRAHSVLSDFFQWHVVRGTLNRDPIAGLERAKPRATHRVTFSRAQVDALLAANHEPRDQIALRLLLHYALRKGGLRNVKFEHFDVEKRRLTIFTKGETIHTLPIVEDDIWELLAKLDEPGHHYLLPKTTTRKRTVPYRHELRHLDALLADAQEETLVAAGDEHCRRELAAMLDHVDRARDMLSLATTVASTRTTLEPAEQIGEHGAHLWWYRCLVRAGVVPAGTTKGRKMHGARHTAIQAALDKTGNIKAAQAVAGHRQIGTTGDIYAAWSVDQTEQTLREVLT